MRFWQEIVKVFRDEIDLRKLTDPSRPNARFWMSLLFVRETFRSIVRNQSMTQAGALAFKTLTALVPMLAIALAVLAMLDDPAEGVSHTENFIGVIKHYIPATSGMDDLFQTIRGFASKAKVIAGVSFLLLFFTAYSLMGSVEAAFNRIWQVRAKRGILSRVTAYLATLILVPILMSLSVYITTRIAVVTESVARAIPIAAVTEMLDSSSDSADEESADANKNEETKTDGGTVTTDPVNIPEEKPAVGKSPDEIKTIAETVLAEKQPAPVPESDALPAPANLSDPDLATNPKIESQFNANQNVPAEQPMNSAPPAFRENVNSAQGILAKIVYTLASGLVSILALACLYYFLPYTPVRWRSAIGGGVFTGLMLEASKIGFRHYAAMAVASKSSQVYGSVLAIPLALLWLWMIWVMVLIGAEIAFTRQNYRDLAARAEIEKRGIVHRLYLAVRTVLMAAQDFRHGQSPDNFPERVSLQLEVPPYIIREILITLEQKEILRRVMPVGERYVPARDLSVLTIEHIVRAVSHDVFDAPKIKNDPARDMIDAPFDLVDLALRDYLGTISFESMVLKLEDLKSSAPLPVSTEVAEEPETVSEVATEDEAIKESMHPAQLVYADPSTSFAENNSESEESNPEPEEESVDGFGEGFDHLADPLPEKEIEVTTSDDVDDNATETGKV